MFAALLLALGACAKVHPAAPSSDRSELVPVLRGLQTKWLGEVEAAEGADHWLPESDCDGTLWAGEARAAGADIAVGLAEYASGEIHRRPQSAGECYPSGSASTVSNDMLMGYVLGEWSESDKDALVRLEQYGEAHDWVMGEPKSAQEVIWSPAGAALLARAASQLGAPQKDYRVVPDPCLPVGADYEYHDQELGIYLDGRVDGSLSEVCYAALKRNRSTYPNDALMAAVWGRYSGDMGPALDLLAGRGAYQCPSYVRPLVVYCSVHKAFAAKVVLEAFGG